MTIDQAKKLEGREGDFGMKWGTLHMPGPKGTGVTIPYSIRGRLIGVATDTGLATIKAKDNATWTTPVEFILFYNCESPIDLAPAA